MTANDQSLLLDRVGEEKWFFEEDPIGFGAVCYLNTGNQGVNVGFATSPLEVLRLNVDFIGIAQSCVYWKVDSQPPHRLESQKSDFENSIDFLPANGELIDEIRKGQILTITIEGVDRVRLRISTARPYFDQFSHWMAINAEAVRSLSDGLT